MAQIPEIIFEDDCIFVVNKPSGWITNDASTAKNQPVLQSWMRDSFDYPLKGDRFFRDGIVHRLDKETSGIILVAKTKDSFEELQSQFKKRKIEKKYTALVHGKVEEGKNGLNTINASVGRLPWRRDRFGVLPGGREAKTEYRVIDYKVINGKDYTLVEFSPKTGRTHQIRIHAKHIGHSIVSDSFYAGRKTARLDRQWCPRLYLHASYIKFFHPKTGQETVFESDLPLNLKII